MQTKAFFKEPNQSRIKNWKIGFIIFAIFIFLFYFSSCAGEGKNKNEICLRRNPVFKKAIFIKLIIERLSYTSEILSQHSKKKAYC